MWIKMKDRNSECRRKREFVGSTIRYDRCFRLLISSLAGRSTAVMERDRSVCR